MGFKMTEKAYAIGKSVTTPTEHAVLLALAFRANDRTGACYPKQETLEEMTHLSRSTVATALNALRSKGFLKWRTGGMKGKRGKYGQMLANDYTLTLPEKPQKRENQVMDNVRQPDMAMSDSQTQRCPPAGHGGVRQPDTAMYGSQTPTEHNHNEGKENITEIPNRRSGTGSVFTLAAMDVSGQLRLSEGDVAAAKEEAQKDVKVVVAVEERPKGVVQQAVEACGIMPGSPNYRAEYMKFSIALMVYPQADLQNLIKQFAEEKKQGKLKEDGNLPDQFLARVKTLKPFEPPPTPPNV